MNILPNARTSQIILNELENELQIYDLSMNKVFRLKKDSAIIYKSCNGSTTFAELNLKYSFTDDLIFLALNELKAANLLINENTYLEMNRRDLLSKVGLAID